MNSASDKIAHSGRYILPVLLTGAICAWAGVPDVFSLESCITYALAHSPGVAALRSDARAATLSARTTLAPQSPMLMAEFGAGADTRLERIGVSQMLMFPGKTTLAHRSAVSMASAGDAQAGHAEAGLVADIRRQYAELYATGRIIESMRQSLDLLKQTEQVVRTAYSTGSAMQSTLLRMQVEAISMEDEIRSMEVMGRIQKERFAALLGLSGPMDIPFPQQAPYKPPLLSDTIGAGAASDTANLSVTAMRGEVDAARTMQRMTAMKSLPDLGLSVEYQLPDMAMGGDDGSWMLGISLSLPVWIGANVTQAREAGARLQAAQQRLDEMRLMVAADARSMAREYGDAVKRVALFDEVLAPQAGQAAELAAADYRTGRMGVMEFLDAIRMQVEIEMKRAREVARRETIAADLDRMLGVRPAGHKEN